MSDNNITIKLKKEDIDQICAICAGFNNDKTELINVLHKTQEHFVTFPLRFRS